MRVLCLFVDFMHFAESDAFAFAVSQKLAGHYARSSSIRPKPAVQKTPYAASYQGRPPGSALTFTHKSARWTPRGVGVQTRW
jgi:hypothetical protein